MYLLLPLSVLCFAIGISIGFLLGPTEIAWMSWIALISFASTFGLSRRPPLARSMILVSFVSFGAVIGGRSITTPEIPEYVFEEECLFSGIVAEGARPAVAGGRYVLSLERVRCGESWEPMTGRVIVPATENASWCPLWGDEILLSGSFSPPRPGLHPFAFQPDTFAQRRGTLGYILQTTEPIYVKSRSGPRRWLEQLRAGIENEILQHTTAREAGVLLAMTTGSRGILDPNIRRDFAATGVAHVIAVSGLHLGLVAWAIFGGFKRLVVYVPWLIRRITSAQIAAVLTLPWVLAYVLLTGAPSSAIRAGIMVGLVLFATIFDRPTTTPHALSLAIGIMLFVRPIWIADLGFQLSVTATAGLVAHSLWLKNTQRSSLPSFLRILLGSIRASLVATFATIIPLLWAFGSIPILSTFANITIVPPLAIIALPFGLVGALLSFAHVPGSHWIIKMAEMAVHFSLWLSDLLTPWLDAAIVWGRPSVLGIIALGLLSTLGIRLFSGPIVKTRTFYTLTLLSLSLLLFDLPRTFFSKPNLTFTSIPVGQGDCSLITFPNGTRMIIDGGGRGFGTSQTGERAILPYLHAMGIAHVDILVSTHSDADHVRGITEIIPAVRPDYVWTGNLNTERSLNQALIHAAANVGVEVEVLHADTSLIQLDNARIEVLPINHVEDGNDGSLMLRICFNEICGLFAGDAESPREEFLLLTPTPLQAAFLKVGHHGSATSSTPAFLDRVRPAIAALQLGRDNHFNFPRRQTMDRLSERGIAVVRTDEGYIPRFVTNGRSFYVDQVPSWRWQRSF